MADSELHQAALEVRILTAIIAKEARQDMEQRLKGYGAPISVLQYRVLRQLQQGRYTIKELSQSCMVEPTTLVPVIDTLERHDFVRRGQDPHDRRRTPLELTAAGSEQLSHIPFADDEDVIVTYLRQLADAERQVFLGQLRDLVATIHGDDHAVRRITEAVKSHLEYGEQQQRQLHHPPASTHEEPPT
jgi:DNA-binding MarR family transcriptional regulator